MPDRISATDVAHVATLARLALTPEELERYTHQLADVLGHFADIDALALDGVEPMTQPYPLANVLRPDIAGDCLDPDEVLSQAPDTVDGFFRVPPILGEAL